MKMKNLMVRTAQRSCAGRRLRRRCFGIAMELRRVAVADSRGRSDGVLQIGPRDRAFAPAMDGTGGRRAAVRIEFHRFPAIQPVVQSDA